ncbi:cellulose synthase subunit BcsC-related outer membrane protein [Aliidiomarina sp.]|uniref:cellulose biosynthesis protein BcsC n=1 Tax=Aliidiomarina sp. TaxID=1872439 RepID=UPI003A4D64E1
MVVPKSVWLAAGAVMLAGLAYVVPLYQAADAASPGLVAVASGSELVAAGQAQTEVQAQAHAQAQAQTQPMAPPDSFSQESAALLEERIGYWYERGRPDRIEGVLQQLLRVHPNSPRIIEVQALLAMQQRDVVRAQDLFNELQTLAPNHASTQRLRELVGLPNEQRNAVADARMLTLAGRHTEAFSRWQQVFPQGPETLELALEYWESAARAGEPAGLANLERLHEEHPLSIRTELTLLRVRLLGISHSASDYQRLIALSSERTYGQEATGILVRATSMLAPSAENYALIQIARQAFPEHAELAETSTRMRRTLDAQRMADMGYASLSAGNNEEALGHFQRAAATDPTTAQWQEMVEITWFWRDVNVFDSQLEAGRVLQAANTLAGLQAHPEAREQPALIALREAQLAAAQGNTEQAYQGFYRVLALQADNSQAPQSSQAAWALLGHYRDEENEPGLREFFGNLSPELQSELGGEYNRLLASYEQARVNALQAQAAALQEQASALQEQGEHEAAHEALLAAYELTPNNPWLVYALALSYEARDELSAAEAAFAQLLAQESSEADAEDTQFAYALFLARQDRDEEARESLAAIEPSAFSEGMQALALRLDERSIQTGAGPSAPAASSELSETVLYVGYDRSSKSGTPGITELTAETLMVDLRVPFTERDGYWFLRVDPMRINAGAADLDDTFWRERFGTGLLCETDCPSGMQPEAQEQGVAIGVGAELGDWWFDIGRSPVGFNRSEWVGGIGVRRELGDFGVRLSADRRIQTTTMISFSGVQDPFSDRSWGVVTRNGVGVGFSWDQGGSLGWWSSLGYDYYSGHNVASNNRWYGYTGGYWRAYESEPFALTVGLTYLSWGFDKDLSQPSFGHGNYYSPELYQSLSVPVTVFGRYQRFSYLLRGAIGYSDTNLTEQVFYPNDAGLQEQAVGAIGNTGINPVWAPGVGGGRSHSFTGNVEYQLSEALYVGLQVNLIRSDTFSPNQGLMYFRYHFGGNNQPVARPPDPPTRYVDR